MNYKAGWEAARKQYENTLEFYQDGRIYGFILKYRSSITNTSMTTFSNDIKVTLDNQQLQASDSSDIQFGHTVTGNYRFGTVVLQKADSVYDTPESDSTDIQQVETDNAGLAGAAFEVYEEDPNNPGHPGQLVSFLPKDTSINGDTYTCDPTNLFPDSEKVTTLEVNADGKLILGNLNPGQTYYLVEAQAPDGYYLDRTPIEVTNDPNTVTYQMLPNVSRAVRLERSTPTVESPWQARRLRSMKRMGHR